MSIENMEMINIIGNIKDIDSISLDIIRQGSVHIINALEEINKNDFIMPSCENDTKAITEMCFIKPYNKNVDYISYDDKISSLMDLFEVQKGIRKKYLVNNICFEDLSSKINVIYDEVMACKKNIDKKNDNLNAIIEFQENIKHIRYFDINFDNIKNMKYFIVKLGRLSRENYQKLKDNIENISSIIIDISNTSNTNIVMSITPISLETEVTRILASLNFHELTIPFELHGSPNDILDVLEIKIKEVREEIKSVENEFLKIKKKYIMFVDESYTKIKMFEKIQEVNFNIALTSDFFYFAGWVPISQKKNIQKALDHYKDEIIIAFKPRSSVNKTIKPPTMLKNGFLSRPFEAIVRMYGLPSYNEKDPTLFVAISYMIMFGCMFGDVGQGFIFFLAGLFLQYKLRRPNLGGILSRLGLSSMFFGFMFGSVFGNEKIIEPILINPMNNINLVLAGGVVLGIIFTTIGFLYNVVNAVKRKDLEEGVFGENGVTGLVFYWIIILTAINVYLNGHTAIPLTMIIIMLCILLAFIVLRQPLSNLIEGNRPLYNEPKGDYFIESGFGIFETLLSMMSKTISFIRVGAFALNHVGLFIAFETMAHMMKSSAGSFLILLLGNIIILGLEGLIVFIQGLRLEYYELFSRYYEGEGIEYNPIKLNISKRHMGISDKLLPEIYDNSNDILNENIHTA